MIAARFGNKAVRCLGLGWVLIGLACGSGPGASAQAPATDEVRQLREELEKARREIESLKAENARLRAAPAPAPATQPAAADPGSGAPGRSASVAPAAGSIVLPAPVADGERVTLERLLADYQASALAGDARYKGRRLQVDGTVRSFKKAFVGLGWSVSLGADDQLGMVRCAVSFPGISDFRPDSGGRVLEGRRPFREWNTLLRTGDRVVFEGVCAGIDGAVIVMKECRPVAEP